MLQASLSTPVSTTTDWLDASALEQARAIRERRVSSEELVRGYLARIERHNPRLNAFVEVGFERALRAARDKDAALRRSRELPPFHGVPIGIKDMNLVRGYHARFGSRSLRYLRAVFDDRTVFSVRGAGFVILGKTATSELGAMPVTEPDIHPPTRNPWNEAFTAGGSSGGSAAALAAGLLPIAQGSDGAGSIRIPAAFCNLIGLKPSRGRVLNPYLRDDPRILYGCGPLARTIDDAAALLDVLSNGPLRGSSVLAASRVTPRPLKIRYLVRSPIGTTHPEHERITLHALKLLEQAGHQISEIPPVGMSLDSFLPMWQRQLATAPYFRSKLQPVTRYLVEAGEQISKRSADAQHDALVRRLEETFGDADAWVTPTVAVPPPRVGAYNHLPPARAFEAAAVLGAFTAAFNVTGQPAVSLPAGFSSEGMPVGVQLIGKLGQDGAVLALARQLEERLPAREHAPAREAR